VANNTSAATGGGLFSYNTAMLTNCTFVGNTAAGTGLGGGGIFRYTGSLALTSCTLTGNSAPQGGGGIASYSTPGPVQLVNTIVAGNSGGGSPDVQGAFASLGHNLIGATDGGTGWVPSDLTGTAANPLDPVLGPLQDNGGPTQTMALLPGSPALDAGDNAYAPQWDQRGPGFPRIVGGIIDLGAFEVQGGGSRRVPPAAFLGQPLRPVATAPDPGGLSLPALPPAEGRHPKTSLGGASSFLLRRGDCPPLEAEHPAVIVSNPNLIAFPDLDWD
jgi:hypothetical protein